MDEANTSTPRCLWCEGPVTDQWPDVDPAAFPDGLGAWGNLFCSLDCADATAAALGMVEALGDQLRTAVGVFKVYPDVSRKKSLSFQVLAGPTSTTDATVRPWLTVVRFSDSSLVICARWDPLAARLRTTLSGLEGDTTKQARRRALLLVDVLLDQNQPGRPEGPELTEEEFRERVTRAWDELVGTLGRTPTMNDLAAAIERSKSTLSNYLRRWPVDLPGRKTKAK